MMNDTFRTTVGRVGALWGVIGVTAFIGKGVLYLGPRAMEALRMDLAWHHWILMIACVIFMAYSEGYMGFQRGFSPRVIARALYMREHPTALRVLAAPLFCMGFFHARRRRLVSAYSLTIGIIGLIFLIRHLPQPWRGIIDAGVLVGLGWGLVTLFIYAVQGMISGDFGYSPEVPDVGGKN